VASLADVHGGLCVYIDGSAAQIADVAQTGRFLVHALQSDVKSVPKVRTYIHDKGLSFFVSVERLPDATPIPYKKNHINLLVVPRAATLAAEATDLKALIHTMAPLGKGCLGGIAEANRARVEAELKEAGVESTELKEGWLVFQKPWPKEMGEWPQEQHGSDGNPVANDTYLGAPNQVQWINGSGGVPLVARGRAIYSGRYSIMARDAASGVRLWQNKKVGWGICVGDNIMASLNVEKRAPGKGALISGKTGEILRTFPMTGQIISHCNGVVITRAWSSYDAYDVKTGKKLWGVWYKRETPNAVGVVKWLRGGRGNVPQFALLMSGDRAFVRRESGELTARELKTGKVLWKKDLNKELGTPYSLHMLFDDKILIRSEKQEKVICQVMTGMESKGPLRKVDLSFIALSMKDGSEVWRHTLNTLMKGAYRGQVWNAAGRIWVGHHDKLLPQDLTPIGDPMEDGKKFRKWSIEPDPMVFDGLNRQTGKLEKTVTIPRQINFHCYQLTVTDRYHSGNRPYYFVNWETGKIEGRFGVVRARCDGIGHRAAQGLFFARGGYGCGCIRTVMACEGAFSSSDDGSWDGAVPNPAHPLEKGTAALPEPVEPADGDWPMLRADQGRRCAVKSQIPDKLSQTWHFAASEKGEAWAKSMARRDTWSSGPLARKATSQPVIANGKAYVSRLLDKCITALDLHSGKVVWTKWLPAMSDAPPTIAKGLALVGCADGWVYALRADNGEMVYRLRIAPAERRIVSSSHLQSAWPVVGGVMVVGDMGYALAGITTEVDGGLYVVGFDLASGKLVWEERRNLNNPGDIGKADHARATREGAGAADVLNSDGKLIVIGSRTGKDACFDVKTGQTGGEYRGGRWTFGKLAGAPMYCSVAGEGSFKVKAPVFQTGRKAKKGPGRIFITEGKKEKWGLSTGDNNPVAIAGGGDRLAVGLSKKDASQLWILSCKDGKKLASYPLPSNPTQDGIAIAKDSVLVTLSDGGVVAFGKR
jgi:outer membrane protein assembly factor BamB